METFADVTTVALEMLVQGRIAVDGKHGYKAAHKRMRKLSNHLTKLLVQLRKESMAACGQRDGGEE